MTASVLPFKKPARFEPVLDAQGRRIPHFRREKASGIIHYRRNFKELGIPPLERSTGETTIGKAKTKAELFRQQHINRYLGVDDAHVLLKRKERTFGDVVDEVLKEVTPDRRPGTQEQHKYYLKVLKREWGGLDINAITNKEAKALVSKLRRTTRRKTFADFIKHVSLVMSHAYQRKYITHQIEFSNPDAEMRRKIENKLKLHEKLSPEEKEIAELKAARVLTRAEEKALWDVMNEDTRDQFALALDMMRLREALHLEWNRVNLETGEVTLRAQDVKTGSKNRKGRSFILSDRSLARLKARRARMKNARFVFPSPKNGNRPINQNKTAWRNAKERAGIKGKFNWHWIRHTALTRALLGFPEDPLETRMTQRKDMLLVSLYAGVSERVIRAVYLHADAEVTRGIAVKL